MRAVPFDTLKLARPLRQASFTNEQAEGAAEAIASALQADLATKGDTIKWMFGTIGFQTIVILGAVAALVRLAKP